MSESPPQKATDVPKGTRQPKGDYDVGYAKPPVQHQFKKGHKPKTTRRPSKGSDADADVITKLLGTKIPLFENGRAKRVTIEEAMVRGLLQKALKCDMRAIATVMKIKALVAKTDAQRLPTEREIREKIEQERIAAEGSQKFQEMIRKIGEDFCEWKRMGIFDDEKGDFADWIHEEAWRRQHGDPEYCRINYIKYIPYVPVGMDVNSDDQKLFYSAASEENS